MRRLAVLFSLLLAMAGGLVVASSSTAGAADQVPVPYGMSAFGFGAKVKGGSLPVGSGPIARAIVACNNIAGITKTSATASVDLQGLGTAEGLETRVWTRKNGDTVSTYARHRIADVELSDNDAGTLAITGIEAWTRAYHDAAGYHTAAHTNVLGITYTPSGGNPQTFPLPGPNHPVVIPGVGTISLGGTTQVHGAHRAVAQATGLRVHLDSSNTTVALARAVARLIDTPHGVFGGIAYGLKASVLGDVVGVGATPQVFMPCAGTDGDVLQSSVATVNLPDVLEAGVAQAKERAVATRKSAKGWEQAEIANVDLANGAIHIEGIKARAYVERDRGSRHLIRSSKGTGTVLISVNGEPQQIPLDGLEIPGLVKIETNLVKKLKAGIEVTAVRLTLLDGSGAVVDLGVARMRVGQLPR
ncbi:choice-of-anchor P family protein [Nocardioides panacisoli]|uniref:CHRD domain-containing protein n=1 Tax=Nocardioides panacisoli TaxID=627624 RepID=A0ABP7IWX3_9ACTN